MTGRFKKALLEKKTPLWQRKEGKDPTGSLSVAGSRSAGVGRPVTKKPSKLKKGSKPAKRRKSFCARMGGMKKKLTSAKTRRDPDSRINKALRKWNCSTDANPDALQQMVERIKANRQRVRQMTTGQTPEEVESQKSLETANPDWLPQEGQEDTERIKQHKARRGVKKVRGAEPQRSSTDIIRNARQGLAEMILKSIQENDALKALQAQGKAKRRADAEAAAEEDKPKHTKRDSLELAGTVTPNHPDYVRKKLYNRPTKKKRMAGDTDADATEREPITSINKRGLTNKSDARQARTNKKYRKLDKVPTPPEKTKKGSYADQEWEPSMSRDTTWGDDDED